jgi:hypothetical protein
MQRSGLSKQEKGQRGGTAADLSASITGLHADLRRQGTYFGCGIIVSPAMKTKTLEGGGRWSVGLSAMLLDGSNARDLVRYTLSPILHTHISSLQREAG